MSNKVDVAIIGAGPYGLSLAAHLQEMGVSHRIFGTPMGAWMNHMPKGMHLKSEGMSSSLYDPKGFTLEKYCAEKGLPYQVVGWPIPIDVFIDYGQEFQRRCVSELDRCDVKYLEQKEGKFLVTLDDERVVGAKSVVLASGIAPFAFIPEPLVNLNRVTHSSDHDDMSVFNGKSVAVIGRGSSAIDCAVLLHEAGAEVRLITRSSQVLFLERPSEAPQSAWEKVRSPLSCMPGIKGYLYEIFPGGFRRMPASKRAQIVKEFVGPAGGWFMKERLEGKFPVLSNAEVSAAKNCGERVVLEISQNGETNELCVDHVLAATGFTVDVSRLTYLDPSLGKAIETEGTVPRLSPSFETSVKNLYVIGPATAPIFGPVMRFACGASFTAKRLSNRFRR